MQMRGQMPGGPPLAAEWLQVDVALPQTFLIGAAHLYIDA